MNAVTDVANIEVHLTAAMNFLDDIGGALDVYPVIAGGLVRDAINQKPFRDIDLYVPGHQWQRVRNYLMDVTDIISPINAYTGFDNDSEEYIHQAIVCQEEFPVKDELVKQWPVLLRGHSVNLIGLRDDVSCEGADIVDRFNLGICQAWITANGPGRTAQFSEDVRHKHITLLRTDWGYEATLKQWIKLQAKYPWPLRAREWASTEGFEI